MQNRDGGWGAFDRECNLEVLTYIPFADHNAMLDPSCEDISGRALEALHNLGMPAGHPAVRAAVSFLRNQAGEGRHVVRAVGSQLHLRDVARPPGARARRGGPRAAALPARRGLAPRAPERRRRLGRAAALVRRPDHEGRGPSTAAQTAWALMSLFALGEERSESVERGVAYLLGKQRVRRLLARHALDRDGLSEESSISATIFTRRISRSGRSPSTGRRGLLQGRGSRPAGGRRGARRSERGGVRP